MPESVSIEISKKNYYLSLIGTIVTTLVIVITMAMTFASNNTFRDMAIESLQEDSKEHVRDSELQLILENIQSELKAIKSAQTEFKQDVMKRLDKLETKIDDAK